jgi:hypothetical protein
MAKRAFVDYEGLALVRWPHAPEVLKGGASKTAL